MRRKSLSVSSKLATEAALILSLLLLLLKGNHVVIINETEAFFFVPGTKCQRRTSTKYSILSSPLGVTKLRDGASTSSTDNDNIPRLRQEDKVLLRETSKSKLVDLCLQFDLLSTGTKEEMLLRLRDYAAIKIEEERSRIERQKKRIEEGSPDDREKHEVVNTNEGHTGAVDDDDSDDGIYFYYESKEEFPNFQTEEAEKDKRDRHTLPIPLTREALTAPPPPPGLEPNEKGERVVTVYSTTDHNDLTGVAASQPGQAIIQDPMTGSIAEPENAPWDMKKRNQKAEASTAEIEAAKEELVELVHSLLTMTGAPGFQNDGYEDDKELYATMGFIRQKGRRDIVSFVNPDGFIGFDPSKVATDTLSKASRSIRMGRGKILKDVVREFELRAVGYDGAAGDDRSRGGGHFRQVSMVRSFLEGYRRAEVGRLARETATMLLDRLVSDGIQGLDVTLSSMSRRGDDTFSEAGELNDSLLDYLNDAIRHQEKKVELMVDTVQKVEELENAMTSEDDQEDQLESLWTVEDGDGTRVESFDPKDPRNQKVLQEEVAKIQANEAGRQVILPKSVAEKLLLLLKLLRERVKIEAAFSNDEKSRNLRILAYCLHLQSDKLRKELISKEFGFSLNVSLSASILRLCFTFWYLSLLCLPLRL
jgi:hypothetical protein